MSGMFKLGKRCGSGLVAPCIPRQARAQCLQRNQTWRRASSESRARVSWPPMLRDRQQLRSRRREMPQARREKHQPSPEHGTAARCQRRPSTLETASYCRSPLRRLRAAPARRRGERRPLERSQGRCLDPQRQVPRRPRPAESTGTRPRAPRQWRRAAGRLCWKAMWQQLVLRAQGKAQGAKAQAPAALRRTSHQLLSVCSPRRRRWICYQLARCLLPRVLGFRLTRRAHQSWKYLASQPLLAQQARHPSQHATAL
mmetsp:Transcript_65153/g.210055  ORF Transcript_65153/g.210055 Transcript_65153/m.210055 type:complete len:256 (-) Transcript_65153:1983-2750(-)